MSELVKKIGTKQDTFKARCINNKYDDFGSHTGFKSVERTLEHLVIGEWYTFKKRQDDVFDVCINGKYTTGTGYTFYIDREGGWSLFNFYDFFSTIEEQRDMKLDMILSK